MIKASMIIMSHLSDAQETSRMSIEFKEQRIASSINFAKFLIMKYPNTSVEVDGGAEYDEFLSKFPKHDPGNFK